MGYHSSKIAMSLFARGKKKSRYCELPSKKKNTIQDCVDEITRAHKTILTNSKNKDEIQWKDDILSPWVLEYVCDGKERYNDPIDCAAYIMTTIATEHPFFDGNKRTSYVVTKKYLEGEGLKLSASKDDYEFIRKIATGKVSQREVKKWIKKRVK